MANSKSYLVSARKYRPQIFSDVVAQEHVTETLKNALRMDRLAHAYLFTGPRGVGKTTAARILAKAINCTTPPEDRVDQAEPCRTCESCVTFEQGRNLNIIEIDAASNNKVDDVRELRDTVRIPPQGGRMKVYIVDEVHMLTKSAFNAFLKTLEEPPPYALFIFATTEPNKVLPTIQSRCQRFDFRRITLTETIDRLKLVCSQEGITADEASLMLIARKGDGALRDALSVFDQAVSLCGNSLVYSELIQALGVVDSDIYFEITDSAFREDSGAMIRIVDRIIQSGYDIQELLDGLAEHLRNLLVLATLKDGSLLEVTSSQLEQYSTEAERFSESVLMRMIHIVSETTDTIRSSRQPRLRLELALLKLTSLPSSLDIRSAMIAIDKLTVLAQQGSLQSSQASPVTRKKPTPPSARHQSSVTEVISTREDADSMAALEQPTATSQEPAASEPPETPEQPTATSQDPAASEPPETPEQPTVTSQEPAASEPPETPASPAPQRPDSEPTLFGMGEPAIRRSTRASVTTENVSLVSTMDSEIGVMTLSTSENDTMPRDESLHRDDDVLDLLRASWSTIVSRTMEAQISLGSLLIQSRILDYRSDCALVGVPDAFHERMLRSEKSRLAQALATESDGAVSDIDFEISEVVAASIRNDNPADFDAHAFLKKKCEDNPALRTLVERFGGEIVW